MKKIMISILMWVLPLSVFAQLRPEGHDVGNGGHVVVCRTPASTRDMTQLLDYYEAITLMGLQPDLPDGTAVEQARAVLQRLDVDAETKASLMDKLDRFFVEAVIAADIELRPIDDSNNIAIPRGCELKQIAVQTRAPFAYMKRYIIDRHYWDLLSERDRAGLIVHEILYGFNLDAADSSAVRALNGLLAANLVSGLTDRQVVEFHIATKICSLVRHGFRLDICSGSQSFHRNGTFESVLSVSRSGVVFGAPIELTDSFASVSFDENSRVLTAEGNISSTSAIIRDITGQDFQCAPGPFRILNGQILSCVQVQGAITIRKDPLNLRCQPDGQVMHFSAAVLSGSNASNLRCRLAERPEGHVLSMRLYSNHIREFRLTTQGPMNLDLDFQQACIGTKGRVVEVRDGFMDLHGLGLLEFDSLDGPDICDENSSLRIHVLKHSDSPYLVIQPNTWLTVYTPRQGAWQAAIKQYTTARSGRGTGPNGEDVNYKAGDTINFDKNGRIISVITSYAP